MKLWNLVAVVSAVVSAASVGATDAVAARTFTPVLGPMVATDGGAFLEGPGRVALAGGGQYRTHDAGATWEPVAATAGRYVPAGDGCAYAFDPMARICGTGGVESLPDWPAGDVLIAPDAPSHIYIGGGLGINESTDGGATWQSHPSSALVVAAGVGGVLIGSADIWSSELRSSTDGGRTWHPAGSAYYVMADDRTPGTFYGYLPRGFVVTHDSGASWHPLLPGAAGVTVTNGQVVVTVANRVLVSTNSGRTFRTLPGRGPNGAAISADAAGELLWGVARSSDGARTWRLPTAGLPRATGTVTSAGGTDLVMQADSGRYRSIDGGRTWTPTWADSNAFGIMVGAPRKAYFYTAMQGNVASLPPKASVWLPVSMALRDGLYGIDPPAVDFTDGRIAYIDGLRTLNGGRTWSKITYPRAGWRIIADPFRARTVYLSSSSSTFYVSHDAGKTWHPFGHRTATYRGELVASPVARHVFHQFTGGRCYVSTDDARHWNSHPEAAGCGHPTLSHGILVASMDGYVWRSKDAAHWHRAFAVPGKIGQVLRIVALHDSLLLETETGLYRTQLA